MVSSYVALGYKCDHNCMNCPLSTFDRLHGQLDEKILMKHIEELSKNKDNLNITLSGGEPTMNPHFFEVLEILGKANAHINILSTATRCSDKEFVDRIIKSLGEGYDFGRLNYISAIHSSDQKIHDKLTGKDGSHLETLKGLENLLERGINIRIKNIFNKISSPTLDKTIEFICYNFSKYASIELCSMDYSGRCAKHLDELYISNRDLRPHVEKGLDTFESIKGNEERTLEIMETPLCLVDPYYWKYYVVPRNGELTYIAPNNEDEENKSISEDTGCSTCFKECSTCDVKDFCSGIWKANYDIDKKENILKPIKAIK